MDYLMKIKKKYFFFSCRLCIFFVITKTRNKVDFCYSKSHGFEVHFCNSKNMNLKYLFVIAKMKLNYLFVIAKT